MPADLEPVWAVSAGHVHTCAVRVDGQLVCFGNNGSGQCDVPADLEPVWAVSVGNFHTCADGQLVCFGDNSYGQCEVPEDLGPNVLEYFGPVLAFSEGQVHTGLATV